MRQFRRRQLVPKYSAEWYRRRSRSWILTGLLTGLTGLLLALDLLNRTYGRHDQQAFTGELWLALVVFVVVALCAWRAIENHNGWMVKSSVTPLATKRAASR